MAGMNFLVLFIQQLLPVRILKFFSHLHLMDLTTFIKRVKAVKKEQTDTNILKFLGREFLGEMKNGNDKHSKV